ncbi:hypothetical protein EJB05_05848, partial [Eragrostis curvula]
MAIETSSPKRARPALSPLFRALRGCPPLLLPLLPHPRPRSSSPQAICISCAASVGWPARCAPMLATSVLKFCASRLEPPDLARMVFDGMPLSLETRYYMGRAQCRSREEELGVGDSSDSSLNRANGMLETDKEHGNAIKG